MDMEPSIKLGWLIINKEIWDEHTEILKPGGSRYNPTDLDAIPSPTTSPLYSLLQHPHT